MFVQLENTATNEYEDVLREKYNKTTDAGMAFTDAMMFIEREGKCCGLDGIKNYQGVFELPLFTLNHK